MKICPQCRAEYQDPSLNFCLEDGTPLQMRTSGGAIPPPTGQVTFGAPTSPSPAPVGGFGAPSGQPQSAVPAPRKSSNWFIWVAVGLVIAVAFCGIATFGLYLIGTAVDDGNSNSAKSSKPNAPKETRIETKFDFSKWTSESDEFAVLKIDGDAAILNTKSSDYYYVLLAGQPFHSDDQGVSVTVSNVDAEKSSQGYGLVFHSDVPALTADYAFLIDSERGEYKIAKHLNKEEKAIVDWRSTDAINWGADENILEVRDEGDSIGCYINGEKVYSFKDDLDVTKGTIGIYSSSSRIRFSKLMTFK